MARPIPLGTQPITTGSNALTIPVGTEFFIVVMSFWGGPGSLIYGEIYHSAGIAINQSTDMFIGAPSGPSPDYVNTFIRLHGTVSNRVGQNIDIYNGGGISEGPIGTIVYLKNVVSVIDSFGIATTTALQGETIDTEADCLLLGFDFGYGTGVDLVPLPSGWTSLAAGNYNNNKARVRFKDTPSTPTDTVATVVDVAPSRRVVVGYSLRGGTPDTTPLLDSPTATSTGEDSASGTVFTTEPDGDLYYMLHPSGSLSDAQVYLEAETQAVTAFGTQNVSWAGVAPGFYYAYYGHRNTIGQQANVVRTAGVVIIEGPYEEREVPTIVGGSVIPVALGESSSTGTYAIDVPPEARVVAFHINLSRQTGGPNALTGFSSNFCEDFQIFSLAQTATSLGQVLVVARVKTRGVAKTFTPVFAGNNTAVPGHADVYFLADVDVLEPLASPPGMATSVDGVAAATASVNAILKSLIVVRDIRLDTVAGNYPALGTGFTNLATTQTPASSTTALRGMHRIKRVTTPALAVFNATTQNTNGSSILMVAFKGRLTDEPPDDVTSPVLTGAFTITKKQDKILRAVCPTATDNVAVTAYEWSKDDGVTWPYITTLPTYEFTELTQLTEYDLAVRARDAFGNRSAVLRLTVSTAREGLTGQQVRDLTGAIGGNPAGPLLNDMRPGDEEDWFSFRIITWPAHGFLNIFPNGTFLYQGSALDYFTYMLEKNGVDVPGAEHDGSTRVSLYNAARRRVALFS